MTNSAFASDDSETREYTPESILAMQWNEFEVEATALSRMLASIGTAAEPVMADLLELWNTRGGDTAAYIEHQELLNGLITQALAIETPFSLPSK